MYTAIEPMLAYERIASGEKRGHYLNFILQYPTARSVVSRQFVRIEAS